MKPVVPWNDGRDGRSQSGAPPLVRTGVTRNIDSPPVAVWVVAPNNEIKPLYVTVGVTPWLLDIQWLRDPRSGRIAGVQSVSMRGVGHDKGWRMLEDMYRDEDRMADWRTFLEHRRQIVTRGVKTEIPDEYLPKALLDRRTRAIEIEGTPDLPPPQSARDDGGPKPEPKGRKG